MATSKQEQEMNLISLQTAFMSKYIREQVLASLHITNMDELLKVFHYYGDQHIMALKIINQRNFCNECKKIMHKEPKDKFMVNRNSKRSVHQALFWIRLLGPYYPINDFLLNHPLVRSNLENICDYSIYTCNGHSKNKFRACINPTHYSMRLNFIKEILYENLEIINENFDILQANETFQAFIGHINGIKHNTNIINIIDLIRWQCPPVHTGHPESNLVNWNTLNYKVLIADLDLDSMGAYARIISNQKSSNLHFEHNCNSVINNDDLQPISLAPIPIRALSPLPNIQRQPTPNKTKAIAAFNEATSIKIIKEPVFKTQKRGIYTFQSFLKST
jgi:hypothetical protein